MDRWQSKGKGGYQMITFDHKGGLKIQHYEIKKSQRNYVTRIWQSKLGILTLGEGTPFPKSQCQNISLKLFIDSKRPNKPR